MIYHTNLSASWPVNAWADTIWLHFSLNWPQPKYLIGLFLPNTSLIFSVKKMRNITAIKCMKKFYQNAKLMKQQNSSAQKPQKSVLMVYFINPKNNVKNINSLLNKKPSARFYLSQYVILAKWHFIFIIKHWCIMYTLCDQW